MIKQLVLLSGRCERFLDHQQRCMRLLTRVKMARKRRHRGCKRQDEAVRTTPKHSVEK